MPVLLESATVQKLTHDSIEIRLRSLEQISAKLQRAFAHNEEIQFKPGELCKQLIRWFGCQPLQAPADALQLLLLVLRSSHADKAIKQLGLERFKREVEKVKLLLKRHTNELYLVAELQQLLRNHEQRHKSNELADVIEIVDAVSLTESSGELSAGECKAMLIQCPPTDYEHAWSNPTSADYTALKFISQLMANPAAKVAELQNALQHLQITMQDYPAEYMLQSPYVYLNMLQLYSSAEDNECCPLEDLASTILVFLANLKQRLRMRRNVLAYAVIPHGSQSLAKTQLKIEKTLQLLMDKSLKLLQLLTQNFRKETKQIFEIITNCLDVYRMQHLSIDGESLLKLHKICLTLKESYEQDNHFTLHRMKYLLFVCLFQDMLRHNSRQQSCVEVELLEPLLCDYSFRQTFPHRYDILKELVMRSVPTAASRYRKLEKYENCFGAAVELLKSPNAMQSAEIVAAGADICIALQKLNSARIAEQLFNAIIECNVFYYSKPELKTQANELLLKLLRLTHVPIKTAMYKALAMAVKKHFACLMNSELYCAGVTHAQLLESHIVGVPLSTTLLLQLVYECAETVQPQISQHAEEVLVLLLKSQHLLGVHWRKMLEILLPVLPLLQCCTHAPRIIELLLKLCNPDCEHLPFLTVLQSNIVFLFHREQTVRSEALTRLIYILNTLPDAHDYVPNLTQISDVIPNDLCVLKAPREFKRIFVNDMAFNEVETLHNLLNLLETPDIEPLIRKTTLMQINVMCQQWDITKAFADESAYYLVLQSLENSMQVESYADYTGAAIPAVGILCKVLLYDAELRRELSDTPNIYVLLLRTLCIYQNDIQLRQDACICLFMLLFSSFLVVLSNQRVEAPRLIANLKIPLDFELQSFAQFNCDADEYEGVFRSLITENMYLRQLVASNFCGGHCNVNKKYLDLQHKYDFDNDLQLTQRGWRLMKASMPELNLRRFLRTISNATEHKSVINASTSLQLQLLVKDHTIQIPNQLTEDLFNMISKYLQLPPGNEMDFVLFEHLLDLCALCVSLPLPTITAGIAKALAGDFQHAFIALLKNSNTPIRLYYKLCMLLKNILKTPTTCQPPLRADLQIFRINLFELLFELITQLFQERDLQRVRCLLTLQQLICTTALDMPDDVLSFYSKRFINLSIALKSSTQTGAQWQRDCLSVACQLYNQMEAPQLAFKINETTIRYLSGLCGHNDRQVRALAWCLLTNAAKFDDGTAKTGYFSLNKELSYLPGGFMACCLCTLLDVAEVILVRRLAGDLFIAFIGKVCSYEQTLALLEQHNFFQLTNEAISGTSFLSAQLPLHFDHDSQINVTNCDLISCYCRICIKMLQLNAAFVASLCESTFMYKLYEMFKFPAAHENPAYYTMCADICHLYGSCYTEKFEFLQRTLCRDQVWLQSFYQLLDQPHAVEAAIINVLQLLLVLCKDEMAHEKLCEKFAQTPEFLVKLLLRAFTISQLNTPFQRCALAVLSMLIIKSQSKLAKNARHCFGAVLEGNVEISAPTSNELDTYPHSAKSKTSKEASAIQKSTSTEESKSLEEGAISCRTETTAYPSPTSTTTTKSAAAYIFVELFRLFAHLFPTQSCKFDATPTKTQIQVSETMAVLLKISPEAQAAAKNLKLFQRILKIFNAFFDDFKCSATTYVRRYGEAMKLTIIKNFQLLLNIHLNWYSSPFAALTDELQALELSKVLMQIWPWLTHSSNLKLLMLQVCSHHSEHSLVVCQQFSSLISGYANSLLQLIIKVVIAETTKVKLSSAENYPNIKTGLRAVMNCCACVEGRVTIVKVHMLDILDGLHPFSLKAPKTKAEILHAWLHFWELFSRYPEGANVRNLRAICDVVTRTPARSTTRIYTLRILRNMCFLDGNRAALLASTEFIHLMAALISQPMDAAASCEEQLHACVSIWKLVTGGVKYVAMVRSTNLAKHMRALREQLATKQEEDALQFKQIPFANDLSNVLDVILRIFNS